MLQQASNTCLTSGVGVMEVHYRADVNMLLKPKCRA